MNLKNKRVLITGATGFIGGHVTEALLEKKAKVYCIFRKKNSKTYLQQNNLHKKVVLKQCDLKEANKLSGLIKKEKFEFVFHLAAKLRPSSFYEGYLNNIAPTINLLEAVKDSKNIKGVFLASSIHSSINNLEKLSFQPYNFSKTISDLISQSYIKNYHLPIITIRFGHVFGPGDDLVKPLRITADIMHSISRGNNFKPKVNVKNKLNFIYVKDIARAFVMASEKIAKVKFKTIDLPAPWQFSVSDWTKQVKQIINHKHRDILKVIQTKEKLLGWQSKASLKQAILETYNWYK